MTTKRKISSMMYLLLLVPVLIIIGIPVLKVLSSQPDKQQGNNKQTTEATSTPNPTYYRSKEAKRSTVRAARYDKNNNEIVDIKYNGEIIKLDQPTIIVNNNTMASLKIFDIMGADYKWDKKSETVTAQKGDITVSLTVGSDIASLNGEDIKLKAVPILQKGKALIPLEFVSEAMGAHFYYYDIEKTAVIQEYYNITKDDVLSFKDGIYYLDGEPFAEISFNLFDFFWKMFDGERTGIPLNYSYKSYVEKEMCLKELSEMGFRTIRVFGHPWWQYQFREMYDNPEKRERYYRAIDTTLELANKYDIGIVWVLGISNFDDREYKNGQWTFPGEMLIDLMGNPESANRKYMNSYLKDIVSRYKDNKAIVMWELANEMTLTVDIPHVPDSPTLEQLCVFADETAKLIKSIDPIRMINSGGSTFRECSQALFRESKWIVDSVEEHVRSYEMMYKDSAIDVVDIHYYYVADGGEYLFKDNSKIEKVAFKIKDFKKIADNMGKPFMVGEFAVSGQVNDGTKYWANGQTYFEKLEDPEADRWIQMAVDEILEGEVALSYWWSYRNEHSQQRGVTDLTPERTPRALQIVVNANKKLKEILGTN